jgi:hypothetical protein
LQQRVRRLAGSTGGFKQRIKTRRSRWGVGADLKLLATTVHVLPQWPRGYVPYLEVEIKVRDAWLASNAAVVDVPVDSVGYGPGLGQRGGGYQEKLALGRSGADR